MRRILRRLAVVAVVAGLAVAVSAVPAQAANQYVSCSINGARVYLVLRLPNHCSTIYIAPSSKGVIYYSVNPYGGCAAEYFLERTYRFAGDLWTTETLVSGSTTGFTWRSYTGLPTDNGGLRLRMRVPYFTNCGGWAILKNYW
jgi:hypothetical protein